MRTIKTLLFLCLGTLTFGRAAFADSFSFGGSITQGSFGSASSNPSLNNIQYGDLYTVTLDFTGSITSAGTSSFSGATLLFSDPSAPASESGFNNPVSVTVSSAGSVDDISLLACVTAGGGCPAGNEITANFSIPSASLHGTDVTAQTIFGLSPAFELFEDGGVTNIQGDVSKYSYSIASPVPEPSMWTLIVSSVGLFLLWRRRARLHRFVLGVVLLLGSSLSAFAVDGVVLINQSTILASGGFPYKITQPGSYRLAGNLIAPSGVDAIDVSSSAVTIDLNGFTIAGTGYVAGSSYSGISSVASITGVAVRNGSLSGFNAAVNLQSCVGCSAQQLIISNVNYGIAVADNGIVSGNIITVPVGGSPTGIFLTGSGASINGNTVSGYYYGIYAGEAERSLVSGNTVELSGSIGIFVACPSNLVGNISVAGNGGEGIVYNGSCNSYNNLFFP